MGLGYLQQTERSDSALLCFSIVANRYYDKPSSADELEAISRAMNNIGYMYIYVFYDYERAYTYLQRSIEINEANHFSTAVAITNMANLQLINTEVRADRKNVNETLRLYRKAYHAAISEKDWPTLITIMSNMINYAFDNRLQFTLADEMKTFVRLPIPSQTPMRTYLHYMGQAMTAAQQHRYPQALQAIRQADRSINASFTPERYVMLDYSAASVIYQMNHQNDSALWALRQAEQVAKQYQAKDFLVSVYRELYKLTQAMGLSDAATTYELMYLRNKNALMNDSKLLNVAEMRFQTELQKVNQQMKDLAEKRKWQTTLLYIAIGVAAVILLFSLLLVRKYREVKERNRSLYLRNVEMLRREEEQRKQNTLPKETETGSSLHLDDDYKEAVLQRILHVMDSNEEVYSSDFSLNRLATLVGSKRSYVSSIINEHYESFYALLNSYRVKEVCRRFNDPERYGNLSIEAICTDVGFKSRSNFNNVFKRITGLTPSEYIRIAKAEKHA